MTQPRGAHRRKYWDTRNYCRQNFALPNRHLCMHDQLLGGRELNSTAPLTEGQVDDDIVLIKVGANVARSIREECSGRALCDDTRQYPEILDYQAFKATYPIVSVDCSNTDITGLASVT